MLVGNILIANIALFAIPMEVSQGAKVAWAIIAYCFWSVGYTMNDVPIFGLITTITSNQDEQTSLNASGRVAALAVSIVIPVFRRIIGGWTATVVTLSIIGVLLMLPICFTAKERVEPTVKQESTSFKEMIQYLFSNKFRRFPISDRLMRRIMGETMDFGGRPSQNSWKDFQQ